MKENNEIVEVVEEVISEPEVIEVVEVVEEVISEPEVIEVVEEIKNKTFKRKSHPKNWKG
jgi:hypothetical protein